LNTQSAPEGRSLVDGLLNDMVALSRRFGEDPQYTRGGGGNISVKADGILYIKPSGTSLSTLTPQSVIALDVRPLMELLNG
jgi:rhamnose utilization protein RhaD (predicted bifunctional aldolase and dehydrogenase)